MRKKERRDGDTELVDVDDNTVDNAEHNTIDELTDGIVEGEVDSITS